jgi:2-polyprenyl-3-methyl-5-hydroxy-6-metoxy-1,4-benzoquinol methylase
MEQATGFQLDHVAAERYEQFLTPIMLPLVATLVERADVEEGASVLDVACGTGFLARTVAARIGPDSRVAATDVNAGMLAVAASRTRSDGAPIEWHEAAAENQPFDEEEFDYVFCQQGLQFVPDLHAALTECTRVLRLGGTFGATVWSSMDHSPYMEAQYEALREALGEKATASLRGAFALDEDRLRATATAAGLTDIVIAEMRPTIKLPALPAYAADHLSALPWGASLVQRGQEALDEAADDMTERLSAYRAEDGTMEVPFGVLVLMARR